MSGGGARPAGSVGVMLVPGREVPPDDGWLGPRERRVLATLHVPKRRGDWRLGRWAAKRAAAAWLSWPSDPHVLAELEVLADESGAPRLHAGDTTPVALSLSHCAGWAIAAVASPEVRLGCDLERVEPRSGAFVLDYFTPAEQRLVAAAGPRDGGHCTTLVWCAKESALKVLREGLRLDTRAVELVVRQDGPERGWWPVAARVGPAGPTYEGWWRPHATLIACLLGNPRLGVPFLLS